MNFLKKRIKDDTIEILVENYFQCIYYLTEAGSGQDLLFEDGDIPEDIRIDEQDMLLIHSNLGLYNLHFIDLQSDGLLSTCVSEIIDIVNSPDANIYIEDLNVKLQQRILSKW